jgi:DNA-binding NtrC family response regulator/pSer/pThr/pTyr-binding forkhead associated (FHA) protein
MNPRIVAISGPSKGLTFHLGPFELVIGKGQSCDIRLDDPLVSARHCGISNEGPCTLLRDMRSATGTFANGFYFPAKILLCGDRIRVGRSIFVYLDSDDAEVGDAILMRTTAEEEWDRKMESGKSGKGAAAYEAAMSTVLDAFLEFNGKLNASRDADEIQSRVCELIFRVMPVASVAILRSDGDTDGILPATYRHIGSQSDEPFPLDEAVTEKTLRDGAYVYGDKVVCFPLSTASAKVGLLYAVMAAEGTEFFTASHVRLFEAVTGCAAVALERARYVAWLEGENRRLNEAVNLDHGMIGRSEKMQQVYQLVGRAGPSDLTVLITGESGTGKELAAKALHRNSPRSQNTMYVVNCAAFTDTLLGSELFGHEKGAFTGADKLRKGLFEFADNGTVFLDEIGECSMTLQSNLLRLIQQREFKRLGGNQVLRANVRIIAATNVDLEKAMKEGRFRQDLYFRLNVIPIHMPRLAERREDIPLLVAEFIKKHGHIRPGAYPRVQGVTPEVRQFFLSYDWPGNVRELENVIEGAIALGTSTYIDIGELPLSPTAKASEPAELGQWVTELNACKTMIIERTLQKTGRNRAHAARLLGLNPKYFSALCKELHVN